MFTWFMILSTLTSLWDLVRVYQVLYLRFEDINDDFRYLTSFNRGKLEPNLLSYIL